MKVKGIEIELVSQASQRTFSFICLVFVLLLHDVEEDEEKEDKWKFLLENEL